MSSFTGTDTKDQTKDIIESKEFKEYRRLVEDCYKMFVSLYTISCMDKEKRGKILTDIKNGIEVLKDSYEPFTSFYVNMTTNIKAIEEDKKDVIFKCFDQEDLNASCKKSMMEQREIDKRISEARKEIREKMANQLKERCVGMKSMDN